MVRGDRLYLSHILDAANRIEEYTADLDLVAFLDDPLRQDGVIRQLGIIGEAVKRLSAELMRALEVLGTARARPPSTPGPTAKTGRPAAPVPGTPASCCATRRR